MRRARDKCRFYADFIRGDRRVRRPSQCKTAASRHASRRFSSLGMSRDRGRSVHAGVTVMPEPFDLVLHLQFLTLKLHNSQIIDRGVGQAFVDFLLERLVLLFELREMRLHRHAVCLLNQWLLITS